MKGIFYQAQTSKSHGLGRRAADSFKELLNIRGVGKKVLCKKGQPLVIAPGIDQKTKYQVIKKVACITPEEYKAAEVELVRLSQLELYPDLYKELQQGKRPSKEAYKKFYPFMDSASNVIRCVGRQAALFKHLKKDYPLLLHPDSHITKVFLRDMHEDSAKLALRGLKAMLATSRPDPRKSSNSKDEVRRPVLNNRHRFCRTILCAVSSTKRW